MQAYQRVSSKICAVETAGLAESVVMLIKLLSSHTGKGDSSKLPSMIMFAETRYIGVLLLLVFVFLLQGCAGPPTRPDNVCSIFSEKRGWHKAAVASERKWGTSLLLPMAFMYQESTFRAKAKPPRRKLLGFIPWRRPSSAYGYAQAINGTWRQYQRSTGEYWRVRNDFSDATDFIHWYMHEAIRINGVEAADAYNLYLNYHEGTTGYSRKTHRNKAWLLRAAENVQRRSQLYRDQYSRCKSDLKPGFFGRLMGW